VQHRRSHPGPEQEGPHGHCQQDRESRAEPHAQGDTEDPGHLADEQEHRLEIEAFMRPQHPHREVLAEIEHGRGRDEQQQQRVGGLQRHRREHTCEQEQHDRHPAAEHERVAEQARRLLRVARGLARDDDPGAEVGDAREQRDERVVEGVLAVAGGRQVVADQHHARHVDERADGLRAGAERGVPADRGRRRARLHRRGRGHRRDRPHGAHAFTSAASAAGTRMPMRVRLSR